MSLMDFRLMTDPLKGYFRIPQKIDPELHEIVIANHWIWSFGSVGINQILVNDRCRGLLSNKLAAESRSEL